MPDFTPILAIQYPTAQDLIRSNAQAAKLASDIQDTALSAERAITTRVGSILGDVQALGERVQAAEELDRPSRDTLDDIGQLVSQVNSLIDDAGTTHQATLQAAQDAQQAAHLVDAPADEQIAALLTGSASQTRQALTQAIGKIVSIEDFGAVGDGTTDDSDALRAAFASGMIVTFDADKTYAYDPSTGHFIVQPGTRLLTNGAKFYELSSVDSFRITVSSNVYVDRLDISQAGGERSRGVLLSGEDIRIDSIRIVARERAGGGNLRRRAISIGAEGGYNARIWIGDLEIHKVELAAAIYDASDVRIDSFKAYDYRQGLLVRDSKHWEINSGKVDVLSPNAYGTPGDNAILIESTRDDNTVENGYMGNFVSNISGEHGFRLGGQRTSRNITWENCTARRSGSGIGSGVEPHNHGGCGFKALGPTSNTQLGVAHTALRFINCTVEDLNPSREKDNFSGFDIGKCRDVYIQNPIVRATSDSGYLPSDYAAYDGIGIIGCEHVVISHPNIQNCLNAGIAIYDGVNTSSGHWGNENGIHVIGGHIRWCRYGVEIREPLSTICMIKIDGPEIHQTEYALYQTPGTESLAFRCSARFSAFGVTESTTLGMDEWLLEVIGDERGENKCRNGSTFINYGNGAHKLRKSGAWVTL